MLKRKSHRAWKLSLLPLAILALHLAERRFLGPHWLYIVHYNGAEEKLGKGVLPRSSVTGYMNAILDPRDESLSKMSCPEPDLSRYAHLKPKEGTPRAQYFFALNLRDSLPILPRLLGSVIEAIRLLGIENCALSIVEGNSQDGTAQVLAALQQGPDQRLETHFVLSSDIDPWTGPRFAKLAALRNLALKPMLVDSERYRNATVVFLNDVAICPDDILELVHQRAALRADMTCAMDWIYRTSMPSFHDVYSARGITGDLFFDVLPNMAWYKATSLFWNDPHSKQRFETGEPVQVFSCWNGAVAFRAEPLVTRQVAFRAAREDLGECYGAETELFSKDMWVSGYGKIAVVPYVNLAYSNEEGEQIKRGKGHTAHAVRSAPPPNPIYWKPPPAEVKCMPTFEKQSWHAWNDSLVLEEAIRN